MTLQQSINKAEEYFNLLEFYPEDDWISLSENWDMNIFTLENKIGFTIYPVINGITDINNPKYTRRLNE